MALDPERESLCGCCSRPDASNGIIRYESTGNIQIFKCGLFPSSTGGEGITAESPGDIHWRWERTRECNSTLGASCPPGLFRIEAWQYTGPEFQTTGGTEVCAEPDIDTDDPCTGPDDVYCGSFHVSSELQQIGPTDAELDAEIVNAFSSEDLLWVPDSFSTSFRTTHIVHQQFVDEEVDMVHGRTARKVRWYFQHAPTASCYLKVWFVRATRPQGGTGLTDIIEELPFYEWVPTESPICMADPLLPYWHSDNQIEGTLNEEPLLNLDGESLIQVKKWSFLPGYEPDDPTGILFGFSGYRPDPDINPNGWPADAETEPGP